MSNEMSVLVVDDERLSRVTMVRQLADAGCRTTATASGDAALVQLALETWDVVLTDLRMPGMDGLELLARIRREYPDTDVLLMTAHASIETAVAAMRAGAADYLTKPFHFNELQHRLARIAEVRGYRREVANLRALLDSDREDLGLIGNSPGVLRALKQARMFAAHDAPVLITGETGTGKEVVARALHRLSRRAAGPFVAVACGAVPTSLAESELFGHERGAFTGAAGRRAGAFERAHQGTLLLDDVDDLPLEIQAALLRVLQDGTFQRVGGTSELRVDVRVLATTKVDLREAAAARVFRDDLYYRLRALEVELPPLRERGEDVLLLAQHFLRGIARDGAAPRALTPDAAAVLRAHAWPGNVRELRHVIEASVVSCAGSRVEPAHLPRFLSAQPTLAERSVATLDLDGRTSIPFAEVVGDVEQRLIAWALEQADGRQTRAAELLGLARTTFQSKLGKS